LEQLAPNNPAVLDTLRRLANVGGQNAQAASTP
jgi:hypothetical protein